MSLTDMFGNDGAEWMQRGLCVGTVTPDLWFPVNEARALASVEQLCGGCPVRTNCVAYALEHNLEGTWGLTDGQRARLRDGDAA
jgi:WhiB family redox-sensing transcriptional regulator